jgi:glutathione S-transferase
LWYDAPKNADPSAPPKGAFILPESGLIVDFIASLYPSIQRESFRSHPYFVEANNPPVEDPIMRARAALMAISYEKVTQAWSQYSVFSDGGKGRELDDFVKAVREFQAYIPEGYVESPEYGVADIMVAPSLVSSFFLRKRHLD